ncbi:unnamed protein product, partial [marine sediment metagenome]
MLTVSLITGSHDNSFHSRISATCLQEITGTPNISLKRGYWISIGNGNYSLCRQMEDGIYFIFINNPFQKEVILDFTPHR